MDLEAEWQRDRAKKEREEERAFRVLFVDKSGDELLKQFFGWLHLKEWWHQFWASFRADGVMGWAEFENFVHWDGRWDGDSARVFSELARHCGSDRHHPHLTASGVLDLKRWWEDLEDKGKGAAMANFKSIFAEKFGSLGCAWRQALDPEDTGKCCFLVFCRVCHTLGMRKNLKSVWEELTGGNPHRSICFGDWDPVGERLVARFAMSLAIQHRSMREGWNRIIKNAGGNLHCAFFVETCLALGIDSNEAQWLFSVLDSDRRRYLTEFDRLKFLSHWDPGNVPDMSLEQLLWTSHRPKKDKFVKKNTKAAALPKYDEDDVPFKLSSTNPYEFVLQLSPEEHTEYQRRLRGSFLTIGIDEQAKASCVKRLAKQEKNARMAARARKIAQQPDVTRRFCTEDVMLDPDPAGLVQN